MSRRRWTDEEIGFVQDNWDKPLAWTARELGRTIGTLHGLRHKLLHGWVPTKADDWTSDEDDIIRLTTQLRAVDVARLLPGRTVHGVNYRRVLLNVDVEKNKNPFHIGERKLVAKTCNDCGLLLDASWYYKVSQRGGRFWLGHCKKCSSSRHVSRVKKNPPPSHGFFIKHVQAITRDHATNHGKEWTAADDVVLHRKDIGRIEKALILGRTYESVGTRCHTIGIRSNRRLDAPERVQWIIDAPNAYLLLLRDAA